MNIILIYNHPVYQNANTIMDHVNSIKSYSKWPIRLVNTELGMPKAIIRQNWDVIILHYSLFGTKNYCLSNQYLRFILNNKKAMKIAFFQDEYQHCRIRFDFINRYEINHIFTLFEKSEHHKTYMKFCPNVKLHATMTGYVSDTLINIGLTKTKHPSTRTVDIGYRARKLPFYMGVGAQEKFDIAERFKKVANDSGLYADIETDENRRINGDGWFEFLSNCKFVIGVEAGVSVVDIDDVVYKEYQRMVKNSPDTTFSEFYNNVLKPYEDKILYRQVSPRLFEAAALKVTQILMEGDYNGVIEPYIHYIPLRKNFQNIDEVISLMGDSDYCSKIADQTYQELIASGKYHYRVLSEQIDAIISGEVSGSNTSNNVIDVTYQYPVWTTLFAYLKWPLYNDFPGKEWGRVFWRKIKRSLIRC